MLRAIGILVWSLMLWLLALKVVEFLWWLTSLQDYATK